MKRIIYDCDPGVDDGLAILLAINSQKLQVEGITTVHGNSPIEKTTNNALRILDYMDSDIPIVKGASKPLKVPRINAESIHGNDGLGDSKLLPKKSKRKYKTNGSKFISDQIKNGVRTIVATGPLTNIALAFQRYPKTMNELEELIIMGGCFHMMGNIDRLTEFNFGADPHAADYVLQQDVKKIIVPLNVTHQVVLTRQKLDQIKDTKSGKLAKSIDKNYQKVYMRSGYKGNPLHDPLAMGYAIDRSFLKLTTLNLRVETEGKYTKGVCVPEERPWMSKIKPNAYVALKVDSKRFLNYFLKTISQ